MYTIMDDNNEEREPVFLTPPSRIELRVGADATGMARANLLDNYDLEENLDDDQYTLSDKIVHYVGGQIFPVQHWNAVKIVLVFKAGCEVAAMHTMTKASCLSSRPTLFFKSISGLFSVVHAQQGLSDDWSLDSS